MDGLVSVVLASYNMGKFIAKAIDSVLQQTYGKLELIIVDDGSTDKTSEIVKKFLSDKRIIFIQQNNQGQPQAKNRAIREARGDFIAFLDADDMWSYDKLEKQLPCFNISNAIGVIYTNMALVDENDRVIFIPQVELPSGKITHKLFIDNFVRGMTCVVKRECFDHFGIFDENIPMGIDYDLWLRISTKYEFYYLNEVTYYYRSWSGQMSHNYRKRYECGIQIMKKFLDNYPDFLEKSVIKEGWAHTYVGRGLTIAEKENDRKSAFKDIWKALKIKPDYIPAWKALIKIILKIYNFK